MMGLSARANDKVLHVARTTADLDRSDSIRPHHLNETINYRMLDRHSTESKTSDPFPFFPPSSRRQLQ